MNEPGLSPSDALELQVLTNSHKVEFLCVKGAGGGEA